MNYIYGLDISMSNTGIVIFEENGNPIKALSIPTSTKNGSHGRRLKIIADVFLELRRKYPTNLIVLESGFSRHAVSTQVIYRVRGLIDYIFYDCQEIEFAPSSIKKMVVGNGRADKEEVRKIVSTKFPQLLFNNDDESDAAGTILCYFMANNPTKL
jgi:crossover junction endodeoxyribonuclease RuvC